jgi:hypothetical protein
VDLLSRDYAVKDICPLMGVSRAGYYKWKRREPSRRDARREEVVALVRRVHGEHPTHGYRWTAAYIRINMQVSISDNYAYKCYRYLGIKAETKHRVHYKPRKVRDLYYNTQRPCFAIGYDTPENYRKRYYRGELPRKQTFESRVLSTEPKFVRKRRQNAHGQNDNATVSTFVKENTTKTKICLLL